MKALDLALKGKVPEHILPSLKKMDSFLREWNIGIVEQRQLFLAIANVLKESKRYYKMNYATKQVPFNYPYYLLLTLFVTSFFFPFDMRNVFMLTNNLKLNLLLLSSL